MKKYMAIFSVILVLVGAWFFIVNKSEVKKNKVNVSELGSHINCHLNIENCIYEYNDKNVEVSLTPKPLRAMVPTTLRVKNLGNFENLSIALKGINMNMGEIRSNFVKKGDTYEATVMFTSCVEDMLYEGSLYSNSKPIGFKFELLLNR